MIKLTYRSPEGNQWSVESEGEWNLTYVINIVHRLTEAIRAHESWNSEVV